ncbi:MAG: hypothetical protein JW953_01400 [Anaerolineae bacterium]|nr:hypothetical protein [Anaerolineae bacterium]
MMIKAGLIGVAVAFIYVSSITLISPFCTLCFTPLLGLGVGYLAGWFDQCQTANASVNKGIVAGGIAGLGAVLGQILAVIISTVLITNLEQLPILMQELGLSEFIITDTADYWQTTLTTSAFCSFLNWGIIAGLGAMGGMFWSQRNRAAFPPISSGG